MVGSLPGSDKLIADMAGAYFIDLYVLFTNSGIKKPCACFHRRIAGLWQRQMLFRYKMHQTSTVILQKPWFLKI